MISITFARKWWASARLHLAHNLHFVTMRYAKADMDLKRQALSQVFPETLAAPAGGKMRLEGTEISTWLRRLKGTRPPFPLSQ